ncbi:MAG TPA: peptidoglycan bridge formation glycyltransferase FemA/FemB family protein, partial [Anaerolineales bacterium]
SVRIGTQDDLGLLYRMYAETSVRDRFVIRDESYYRFLWQTFMSGDRSPDINDGPRALPLIAEVSGNPVAALVLFYFAHKAWYMFGMSREAHREKMPNHLLQWEAMRRAKLAGCTTYDLWGAPDEFVQSDPLWGVYRFKEGLGGVVVRHLGAWDLPIRPVIYKLYTELLPRILAIMRRRGRFRTQRMVSI